MKKTFGILAVVGLVFAVIGFAPSFMHGPGDAQACGYGRSGGGDYAPQQQGPKGALAQRSPLSSDQARAIATDHIKRLNPALTVGQVNDAGSFYEAEVLNGADVIQLLGVDKLSGRLMTIQ